MSRLTTNSNSSPPLLTPSDASWLIPAPPITISGDEGWSECPWVNGSGTWEDPFILCNLTINAGGIGNCINITNTFKCFKIINCTLTGSGTQYNDAGIYMKSAGNGTFLNNTCTSNRKGFYLQSASNNTLIGNICNGNIVYGIELYSSSNNTLTGNDCSGQGGYDGICVRSSSNNNLLTNNTCAGNRVNGISVYSSRNNIITNNTCTANSGSGIDIGSCQPVIILSNNILIGCSISLEGSLNQLFGTIIYPNNTVNGRPVRVYVNQTGVVVDPDSGQVILINCTSSTIEHCQNPGFTIVLFYSSNNIIRENNCSGGSVGIYLYGAQNNTLEGNTCTENGEYGIYLCMSSTNNTLTGNNCTGNGDGIHLYSANNNTLTGNTCTGNSWGISISTSSNNMISGNNCTGGTYGIIIASASNNNITQNTCTSSYSGIFIGDANNNYFTGNNCSENEHGIYVTAGSSYNSLTNNTCLRNSYGIYLLQALNTTMASNNCTRNTNDGIYSTRSNASIISGNTCSRNKVGIVLDSLSYFNEVFQNRLIKSSSSPFTNANPTNNVYDNIIMSFLVANFTVNCSTLRAGHNVSFTDTTIAGVAPLSYQWDFGDGTGYSTQQNPEHQFNSTGTWVVILTVTDAEGDISTYQIPITVTPCLTPSFMASDTEAYTGASIIFNDTTTGGLAPYTYQWNFSDGSEIATTEDVIHSFDTPGTFTVELIVTDFEGTTSNFQIPITIYLPLVNCFTANVTEILFGESINFTSTTTGGLSPYTYQWNFGDGSENATIENVTHQFIPPGSYTVTLTVTDDVGHGAIFQVAITVNPPLAISFTPTTATIVAGEVITFNDTSTGGFMPYTYQWNFGDGSENATIENVTHQFIAPGSYTVTLTLTDARVVVATTFLQVEVVNTYPWIEHLSPILINQGSVYQITWYASDFNTNNPTFTVTLNGAIISSGPWIPNASIIIELDGLAVGTYIYALSIDDGYGGITMESVLVKVFASPPPTDIVGPLTFVIASSIGVGAFMVILRKWRARGRRGRVGD